MLLLYAGTRLYQLDALPLFIDESIIIEWSLEVREGSPIGFGYHGKYLLPWTYAFFYTEIGAYWSVRVVTILFLLIGASAIIRLGKLLDSWLLGIITLLVMTFTPMLFFYDRLALTDTILHAAITLFVLSIFYAFNRPRPNHLKTLSVGVTFIIALLAKSTAFVLLPLPVVGIVFLTSHWRWRERLKAILMTYGTILVFWLPLQSLLMWRGINYFGLAGQFSSEINNQSLIDKLLENSQTVLMGFTDYFGWHGLIALIIAMLVLMYKKPRSSMVLIAAICGFFLALILAAFPGGIANRYWLSVIPLCILIIVYAIVQLPHKQVVLSVVVIFSLLVGIPFQWQAYTAPFELNLPRTDRLSYIESDASGTMLPEVADFIDNQNQPALVAIPQCFSLQLYTQQSIECFNVVQDNQRLQRLMTRLDELSNAPFLLILEAPGYVTREDISLDNIELLTQFERPGGRISINIYLIQP